MTKELKAHRLTREIADLQKELRDHQEKCKHSRGTYKYDANTGNWCEGDDKYWISCHCSVCGKRWRAYSHDDGDEYRQIPKNFTEEDKK